jgi:molybdopterin synthase catalytic subunit
MNTIRIQQDAFDIGAEIAALASRTNGVGAVATFTGFVRPDDGLTALTLEHYPQMTEREIARHIADASERWPLLGATIIHRVGRMVPGEPIVLVAVAASHRSAAFQACDFLMDYLKTRAPFWKREERDGALQWVEAKASDDAAAQRWRKK